jgi:hypothetical protein
MAPAKTVMDLVRLHVLDPMKSFVDFLSSLWHRLYSSLQEVLERSERRARTRLSHIYQQPVCYSAALVRMNYLEATYGTKMPSNMLDGRGYSMR